MHLTWAGCLTKPLSAVLHRLAVTNLGLDSTWTLARSYCLVFIDLSGFFGTGAHELKDAHACLAYVWWTTCACLWWPGRQLAMQSAAVGLCGAHIPQASMFIYRFGSEAQALMLDASMPAVADVRRAIHAVHAHERRDGARSFGID